MARKIPLRVIEVRANGFDKSGELSYGEMMRHVLEFAHPARGVLLDEVLRAVDAAGALKKAVAGGADHVVFTEDQYQTLRDKLDVFPFAMAVEEIAEFGLAIRNAPELMGDL